MKTKSSVAIIMGSDSDYETMKGAIEALKLFQIKYVVEIVSAHRTPKKMSTFASSAEKNGIKIIIAGAGGAAHLPGMVASMTHLPVIGVPVCVGKLKGLDALLSIAQMPKGIPVATVSVDNSFNAGLLAARILGINNNKITQKLKKYQNEMKVKVQKANARIKSLL